LDRYRLIAGIVVCFIYLLAMFPWQTITVAVIIAIAYFILKNTGTGQTGEYRISNNGREVRRRQALSNASIYLAPYSDIWRNLKLSNTYCSLRLQSNGYTIVGRESVEPYRTFRVMKSNIHADEDLWNMFCDVFDHNTRFDRLIELCRTFQVDIKIEGEQYKLSQGVNYSVVSNNTDNSNTIKIDTLAPSYNTGKKEKIDINNASEVEITSLPGISIVLSKKIIKKREELGGFKDVNEFLQFTQLKPHMRAQLRDLVCVNKMKGSGKIKRNSERSVDL